MTTRAASRAERSDREARGASWAETIVVHLAFRNGRSVLPCSVPLAVHVGLRRRRPSHTSAYPRRRRSRTSSASSPNRLWARAPELGLRRRLDDGPGRRRGRARPATRCLGSTGGSSRDHVPGPAASDDALSRRWWPIRPRRVLGLRNSYAGLILIHAAIELPFLIW